MFNLVSKPIYVILDTYNGINLTYVRSASAFIQALLKNTIVVDTQCPTVIISEIFETFAVKLPMSPKPFIKVTIRELQERRSVNFVFEIESFQITAVRKEKYAFSL